MGDGDNSGLLLRAALGDLAVAAILAVAAALLLRRFLARLVERHPKVAKMLIEPDAGRGQRLYLYLKARRSRELNDPRAHALAFTAYLCAVLTLILIALAIASVITSFLF